MIFTTHYHNLVKELVNVQSIQVMNMACKLSSNSIENSEISYLYNLVNGISPESYGINVAKLAGLCDDITKSANHISKKCKDVKNKNININNNSKIKSQKEKIRKLIILRNDKKSFGINTIALMIKKFLST